MIAPATDEELHDWLRWAEENGSSFLRTTAETALIADLKHYNLLRPVLLELKKECPKQPEGLIRPSVVGTVAGSAGRE
jgi:hypothetical protein